MRSFSLSIVLLFVFSTIIQAQTQTVHDDFEGNGTITTWYGDACNINTSLANPYPGGINTSATVLEYNDVGGQYANVRFDVSDNFDLSSDHTFTLKIYVPSSGITGNQPNQVSLKLQDGTLNEPWLTQSDIIKTIVLDQWQTIEFDFLNDNYINLDPNSAPPTQRTDFNRVLIQINGENNYDHVLAYIDDVKYMGPADDEPESGAEYDVLVWSDEFDGDGPLDDSKWFHETLMPTEWGWHNNEIQHYTDRADNANVENGILNIIGKKEAYTDQGVTKEYTSARLNSKFAFQYGKVEVRAKLPAGVGTWPAIWMLGKNIDTDGSWWAAQGYGTTPWPDCGEIDIMEHWGTNQDYISSATHTPSSSGATVNLGGQTIPTASTEFHTYSLSWYPDKLIFSVDDVVHYTYQPDEFNNDTWPYNAEQYLLLNFALLPEIDPNFTADTLEIDYVRVYQSQTSHPVETGIVPYANDDSTILLMHFDGDLVNNSTLSSNGNGNGLSYSNNTLDNFGQCIALDGSSYVTVPHHSNLNLNGDWTIEAWINITSFNSTNLSVIVRKPGDTDDYFSNYALELNPFWDNVFHGFYFSNENIRVNVTEMSPALNQWYHVAFIRDVSNSILTINVHDKTGTLVSSSSQNDTGSDLLLNVQDLRIGEAFVGYIDELRISNIVRSFSPIADESFPVELDQERIENKVSALNLHKTRNIPTPYKLLIDVISSAEYESQKPAGALDFDCGYVNEQGKVYVSEPTTAEQLEVFSDIDQAATYYMCQSFLQHYYLTTAMPIWFKTGFAAYESDIRFDDADIKTAYSNYNGTLTSFDVLNNPTSFVENNGLAVSYLFGEMIGVFKSWSYDMVKEVNASTIIPESRWYNAGTIEELFDYFMRYLNARILETNDQERLKRGMETEHFKHYYRESEDYWLAHFPDILEEAIKEYKGLMGFETFEKISSLTMPICNYVTIGGGECVNLRYTSGTAWSSGIWASSPDTDNAYDIEMFDHLIRHELAHLVQTHLPAGNMTAWLNEGFAEFLSRRPDTQEEKEALKNYTQKALDNARNYFGHLPTFEDTRVYPGQTNVDYYLLGQIMQNFIYERGGYSAVKDIIIDHQTGIANLGYSSVDDFMSAYYYYLDVEYLQKEEADYFTDYDKFITKLTELTGSVANASELDAFWNELIAAGNFPFVIGTRVAFLYRGTANTVSWVGEFNEWNANADFGVRLGVSNIWLLEKELPSDARLGYKIVINGSDWITDENNPYPATEEWGNSDLRMPDYEIPYETILRPSIPKGTLSDNILRYSTNLGYNCQYRVYTPAGYSELSDLPVVYVTDGQSFSADSEGKMKIILDNLIYDELIEPIIAVFLDPRDPDNLSFNRRSDEYRNNINFVNYVTQELVPDIDRDYKTNASPGARGIAGYSYGGYNAAYFCAMAAETIKNTAILSPIMHPNPPESGYNIYDDMMAADLTDSKIYMSYGIFDTREVGYFEQLKNIFDQKGKEFEYDIVNQGHSMSNWSGVIGNALKYFYSIAPVNNPPVVSDIPNQTIREGDVFTAIILDNYVTDIDNNDSEITWTYSGNEELQVEINENRIANITMPQEVWTGSETITFTASDPHEAIGSDAVLFTSNQETVISDHASMHMYSVYPNPASDRVYITVPGKIDLSIFSISGKKILENTFSESGFIDIANFKKGVYILSIMNENETIIKKLIIE